MLSATIEHFGAGEISKHRVRDLSPGGIRIDGAERLKVGATVLITVGALEAVGATVKWSEDGHAGLAFVKNINPEQARAKAAITPKTAGKRTLTFVRKEAVVPTAGWSSDLRDPYRRS